MRTWWTRCTVGARNTTIRRGVSPARARRTCSRASMMATMVFPAPVSSTAMVFPRSAAANTSTWYLHAREPTSAQTLPHGRTARDQSPSISTPAAEAACAGGEEAGAAPAEVGAAGRRPRTWRRPPLVRCGWSGCGGGGGGGALQNCNPRGLPL